MLAKPNTLTLITTHQCTAACDHCCFNCTPKTIASIPVERMHALIDEALDIPSIDLIVFTGGECFLLGDKLFELIEHSKRNGYKTRCITNGYWATEKRTANIVSKLKVAGLDEINFSAGDEHSSYVPIDRIRRGSLACSKEDIATSVSVEKFNESSFDFKSFVEEAELKKAIEQKKICVRQSFWIKGDGTRSIVHLESDSRFKQQKAVGCRTAMTVLAITPKQSMVACCGLHLERIPELHIGSVENRTIAELLREAPDDFLKIWLHVEGPENILRFVKKKDPNYELPLGTVHPCTTCLHLYTSDEARKIVQLHYNEVEQKVCRVFLAGLAGSETSSTIQNVSYGDE